MDNKIIWFTTIGQLEPVQPLCPEDPIWRMVGAAESGVQDVSANLDHYLAEGEVNRWKK